MEIKRQNIYLPTEESSDLSLQTWSGREWNFAGLLKLHGSMIVLTKEQFEKAISDAKDVGQESMEVLKAEDMDYLFEDGKEKI